MATTGIQPRSSSKSRRRHRGGNWGSWRALRRAADCEEKIGSEETDSAVLHMPKPRACFPAAEDPRGTGASVKFAEFTDPYWLEDCGSHSFV